MFRVDLDQGLEESTRTSSVFLPRVLPTKNIIRAGDALLRGTGHPGTDALGRCVAKAVDRGGVHVGASLEELVDNYLVAAGGGSTALTAL